MTHNGHSLSRNNRKSAEKPAHSPQTGRGLTSPVSVAMRIARHSARFQGSSARVPLRITSAIQHLPALPSFKGV